MSSLPAKQIAGPSAEVIQTVLLGGDLSKLTPEQRVSFYNAVCSSLGLNPLTRPFDYMRLSGKEILYAKKDCAEQLRMKHKVSLSEPRAEVVEGMYTVWVTAKLPDGRTDADMGAVDLGQSKGEMRANLMLKAVTKAKRRVTLSICGLGMLDETEVASIPGAQPMNFNPETGEVFDAQESKPAPKLPTNQGVPTLDPTPKGQQTITEMQRRKLFAVARKHGWKDAELKDWLRDLYGYQGTTDIPKAKFNDILAKFETGSDGEVPA